MAGYVKTLYEVTLFRESSTRTSAETVIFEMRSIKTAEFFERILKRARLPVKILDPKEKRPRNNQGWRSRY